MADDCGSFDEYCHGAKDCKKRFWPIVLGHNVIAYLKIFHRTNHLEEIWVSELGGFVEAHDEATESAAVLVEQLTHEGQVNMHFMVELAKAVLKNIREHDVKYGTAFAHDAIAADRGERE